MSSSAFYTDYILYLPGFLSPGGRKLMSQSEWLTSNSKKFSNWLHDFINWKKDLKTTLFLHFIIRLIKTSITVMPYLYKVPIYNHFIYIMWNLFQYQIFEMFSIPKNERHYHHSFIWMSLNLEKPQKSHMQSLKYLYSLHKMLRWCFCRLVFLLWPIWTVLRLWRFKPRGIFWRALCIQYGYDYHNQVEGRHLTSK